MLGHGTQMGPRSHPAGPAAGSDVQPKAFMGLRPATSRRQWLQPLSPLDPAEGGQQVWPQAQGCSPALGEAGQAPGILSMSRWPSGVMGTCWGVGGVLCWLLSGIPSARVQSMSLCPWGKGVKGRVSMRSPAPGSRMWSPCQGLLVPTKCPISERCAGSKGEQLRGAWGGHHVGWPWGPELLGRVTWEGQSHLADVPSPKPRSAPFLRGENAAGKPQGAFIRERPRITFHMTKPREPPTSKKQNTCRLSPFCLCAVTSGGGGGAQVYTGSF